MSILIKGMEVPESCGECLQIGWQYVFECNLDDVEEGKKLITCPLVPVPPHGRLIDADVVAQDLQDMSEDIEKSFPYLDKNDALMIERGVQFARQYVLNLAPTIIEAEDGTTK